MKHKKSDAIEVCKEFEDVLAPRLNLTVIDRTVYYHLLRHTRWEGKLRLRFMVMGIGAQLGLSRTPVRSSLRRLASHGLLRIVERNYNGTVAEVRLPSELRAVGACPAGERGKRPDGVDLDGMDFLRTESLRQSIHAVFLLLAANLPPLPHPGSRRAARTLREQFVPQLGFLLRGMQPAEAGAASRRFPAPALPRRPPVAERPLRPPPSPPRPRRRPPPPTRVVGQFELLLSRSALLRGE